MLFVHEVHQVVGTKEDEFEAAYRDGWMRLLAKEEDAALLWYMNHAHGSGVSYSVVTITGVGAGDRHAVHGGHRMALCPHRRLHPDVGPVVRAADAPPCGGNRHGLGEAFGRAVR